MCAKSVQAKKKGSPSKKVPAPKINSKAKPYIGNGVFQGVDLDKLLSGPRSKLVTLCKKLVEEKDITLRTEFGRFAPTEITKFIRKNPELWDEIGIGAYRNVPPENGGTSRGEHYDARDDFDDEMLPDLGMYGEVGDIDFLDESEGRPARLFDGGPDPVVLAARREVRFMSSPSGTPMPSYLFKKWSLANADEKLMLKKRLFKSAVSGPVEEVTAMLDRGIPINLEDEIGSPFFMRVAERGRTDLLKEILPYMDSVDMRDESKHTVLMTCAECGNAESVKMLLSLKGKNKPELNARDNNNRTALMLAAWAGNLEEVRLLCNAGASHKLKDKYRNTALDYAKMEGHDEVVEYLKSRR